MSGSFRKKITSPIRALLRHSSAAGIILLGCTVLSLVIANNSPGETYVHWWHTEFQFLKSLRLPYSVIHIINDVGMSLFFFLAGMEIKREMRAGELSSLQKSALPVVAAIGGMIGPAFIFIAFNKGTVFQNGWGIPTATDIAFSLGIASLLGKRVPVSLKIFLTALAIIDDIGAIIIIAFFYGGPVHLFYLAGAGVIIALLSFITTKNRKFGVVQILVGVLLWYCVYNSGIHPTVAGVIFAFFVPTRLLYHYENKIYHAVYFVILPLFALANTAIVLPQNITGNIGSSLSAGIILGLCIGKPLGIIIACFIMVRKKIAALPTGINWYHMTGMGLLAGIGFTMSIFIASLAFEDNKIQDIAKIGVLAASLVSMVAGYCWLRFAIKRKKRQLPERP